MNPNIIELDWTQVALAVALVAVVVGVSLALSLGLTRSLLIASVRTVLQLTLIGFVLTWVFSADRWYVVIGILLVMTLVTGQAAVSRIKRRYRGVTLDAMLAMGTTAWLMGAYGVFVVIQLHEQEGARWYDPQYTIPLLGMLLGNVVNGVSLGMNRFTSGLYERRDQVEAILAMGGTRWEAARDTLCEGVAAGLTPILNAMTIVGLVSLPGMMTGQLLAGADPLQAVAYQIVIMFLIAVTATLGTLGALLLAYRRLFNERSQFLVEKLRRLA